MKDNKHSKTRYMETDFIGKILNLQDEIKRAIIGLLKRHGVAELHFPAPDDCPDAPDTVYVIFFDKSGDPYECAVNSVSVVEDGLSLTATDKIYGGVFTTESPFDLSVRNPVWLNEIYEAAQKLLGQVDSETTT